MLHPTGMKTAKPTSKSTARTAFRSRKANAERLPAAGSEGKENFKPGTMLYPLPVVLVGCGASEADYNLITIAWTGILCTEPPMLYIAVRPERHSHPLICKYGEFTVNLTTAAMAKITDWCGVKSGKDFNKFKECGLHVQACNQVKAPAVQESPLSLECKVRQRLPLGSHEVFMAEIVNVMADRKYLDPVTGKFNLAASGLLVYEHGNYFETGAEIGHFGFSVRKKKNGRS